MALTPRRLRLSAALGGGILFVHDVGYRLAPRFEIAGPNSPDSHGYLELAFPVIGLIVVVAIAEFLLHLFECKRVGATGSQHPSDRWLPIALALFFTVLLQESAELAVSGATSYGALSSLFGFALIAGFLSLFAGFAVACLMRGARCLEEIVAKMRGSQLDRAIHSFSGFAPRLAHRPRVGAIADHLASRAPPTSIA